MLNTTPQHFLKIVNSLKTTPAPSSLQYISPANDPFFDNQEIANIFKCHFIAAGNISVNTDDAAGPNQYMFFCWHQQMYSFFLLTGCYMFVSLCDFLSALRWVQLNCCVVLWHPAQIEALCRSLYATQPWQSGAPPDRTGPDRTTYQMESSCNYAHQKEDRPVLDYHWSTETHLISNPSLVFRIELLVVVSDSAEEGVLLQLKPIRKEYVLSYGFAWMCVHTCVCKCHELLYL